jgi:CBS domain-containing protein
MPTANNNVSSVLVGQQLIALSPEQTVRQAAEVLCSSRIGAAPVISGERLVGVFSERDILRKVVATGLSSETSLVGDIMTREPKTVTLETSLVEAFAMMVEGHFRHLPVVRNGNVIAMLSMRDVPPEHRIMHRQWVEWTKGGADLASVRTA